MRKYTERRERVSFCLVISTLSLPNQTQFPMALYQKSDSETGYDLSDDLTHKLFVLGSMKFVTKVFSKVMHRVEMASDQCTSSVHDVVGD